MLPDDTGQPELAFDGFKSGNRQPGGFVVVLGLRLSGRPAGTLSFAPPQRFRRSPSRMRSTLEHVSFRGLAGFVLLSAAGVALLAMVWKFGIEEWLDPYLLGDHGVDSIAERWEFVVMSSLFSILALLAPSAFVFRLFRERLAANRLAAAVFKSAPQPMVVTDAARRVIAVNPAFEKLTGYQGSAVVDTAVSFLKSDLNDGALYAEISRSLDNGGSWSGEVRNRRPDGSQYVIWLTITCTRDETGQVSEFIGVLTDITWRKRQEEEAMHLATHDPLTGLANRRLFMERLEQVLASVTVTGERLAVLFVDLDGFKGVNDTHGHAVGDQVLKAAAGRLAACARSADLVARLSGDEFVLLLRNVEATVEAEVVAQRCIDKLKGLTEADGQTVAVGASIGVAMSSPMTTSADALLELADRSMYAAKRRGKGIYVLQADVP
jgi:diguanylate cyclase (GGDEF)-like protein/PAS domain S-box-containing protein